MTKSIREKDRLSDLEVVKYHLKRIRAITDKDREFYGGNVNYIINALDDMMNDFIELQRFKIEHYESKEFIKNAISSDGDKNDTTR